MQRFFTRFAWNDLSVRAKIGVILGLMLVLVTLSALIASTIIGTQGARTRQGLANTVQIRSLAQDIQLETQTLQRLQSRLMEDYHQAGFDPSTTTVDDQYHETIQNLLGSDIPKFHDQSLITATPEEQQALEAEFASLQESLNSGSDNFDRTFEIINLLSNTDTGAIATLQQQRAALTALVTSLNSADINQQLALVENLEAALLLTGTDQAQLDLRQAVQTFRIVYQDREALNPDPAVFEATDAYLAQVEEVTRLLAQLDLSHRTALTNLTFASASASRLGNIADDQANRQINTITTLTTNATLPILYTAVIQLLVLAGLMYFFGRTVIGNLRRLLDTTQRFEQGNFRARVTIEGHDEFSHLGRSFNAMAAQLADLVGGLEARVAERTRDLSITAEIGQAVLTSLEPRQLMQEVVELVRERFDFYHVQVFVVDDARENARLIASTGTVGRELLTRRHALPVGSQSVIGQVTGTGQPVIALDTDTSAVHRRNELLPDTRSEMALPMRIGDQVIGALDVQSVVSNAFDEDAVAVFQIMADQLAISLENSRLHAQLQQAQIDLESLERNSTAEAWRSYQKDRDPNAPRGFEMQGEVILPSRETLPVPIQEAIHAGRVVARENGESDIQIAMPIRVRGEVIGAFGFGGESLRQLNDEDLSLVEAVIDRVGLALENMRLVEQTARRAEYEQIVNEITAKIVGSTDINYILQTTVKELGRALRAPQTSVQLRREPMEQHDEQ